MKLILFISYLSFYGAIATYSDKEVNYHQTQSFMEAVNKSLICINKYLGTHTFVVLHDVLKVFTNHDEPGFFMQLAVIASSCEKPSSYDHENTNHYPLTLGECGIADDNPAIWNATFQLYKIDSVMTARLDRLHLDTSLLRSFPKYIEMLGFKGPHAMKDQFEYFREMHRKEYTGAEYERRLQIFTYNILKARLHQKLDKGTAMYGMTRFSDITADEFKRLYTGYSHKSSNVRNDGWLLNHMPKSIDWRKFGAVTEVKNQGMCGSCWAFAVTGNIEGQWFRKTGKLISLSEQELLDCDAYDSGCNGGRPELAYAAIKQLGGLMSEEDYPYRMKRSHQCYLKSSKVVANITGSVRLPKSETLMAKWVAYYGPISVSLNADTLQHYIGGIAHPSSMICSPDKLNHAVLIVGYDDAQKIPYWIVKNSWGASWGEEGYFRMYRGDGTCGINVNPTSSITD